MVLGRDSRKRWGKWDFLLAKAYQRYLDELCPQCGMPVYVCHSEDSRVEFKITKDVCFATAEVERAQKRESDKRGKNASPDFGMRFIPEPKIIEPLDPSTKRDPDMDLSDLRQPYYRAVAIRKGLFPQVDSDQ